MATTADDRSSKQRVRNARGATPSQAEGGSGSILSSEEPSQLPSQAFGPEPDAARASEQRSVPAWSIECREELLSDHPVVRGHYIVPTPMLVQAHQEARDRVWSRRTGIVFFGETRAGKTTCASSIRDYLAEEFETIYITMASGRMSLRPKHGLMARLILEGNGHVLANRPDPDSLMRNVVLDVQTNLSDLGGDQYVLILDEVNLCNEDDFTELLEIHNILWMKGIKMTTISFGQPEILHRITSLMENNKHQIIARFFRRPIPFLSCSSETTLAAVLKCLDEDTEWPDGSGWTYTYFFFPKAFRAGFRLSKYAALIWSALAKAAPHCRSGFTMEAISLTVNSLYVGNRHADREDLVLSAEDIARALDSADL
jgi:hypothetical protein